MAESRSVQTLSCTLVNVCWTTCVRDISQGQQMMIKRDFRMVKLTSLSMHLKSQFGTRHEDTAAQGLTGPLKAGGYPTC